ncbi:hypothetical protein OROMI_013245 [Orobanche minor]
MDLGSAKVDLKRMLTLKAVNAAFASSELKHIFINFIIQQLLLLLPLLFGKTFTLIPLPLLAMAKASELLLLLPPLTLAVLTVTLLLLLRLVVVVVAGAMLLAVAVAVVILRLTRAPPLSTSVLIGSLHGNHLEPCKNGMILEALIGEIPKTLMLGEDPIDCFTKEINPITKGDCPPPPRISPARVEYMEVVGLLRLRFDFT